MVYNHFQMSTALENLRGAGCFLSNLKKKKTSCSCELIHANHNQLKPYAIYGIDDDHLKFKFKFQISTFI